MNKNKYFNLDVIIKFDIKIIMRLMKTTKNTNERTYSTVGRRSSSYFAHTYTVKKRGRMINLYTVENVSSTFEGFTALS